MKFTLSKYSFFNCSWILLYNKPRKWASLFLAINHLNIVRQHKVIFRVISVLELQYRIVFIFHHKLGSSKEIILFPAGSRYTVFMSLIQFHGWLKFNLVVVFAHQFHFRVKYVHHFLIECLSQIHSLMYSILDFVGLLSWIEGLFVIYSIEQDRLQDSLKK